MRNLFESSYTAIGIRIEQTIEGQEYRPEVQEFMRNILNQRCGSSQSTVSQALLSELSSRWNQRSWFVIVYGRPDGTIAGHEHQFDGSFHSTQWWSSCKHAVALSFPTRQNSQMPEQFNSQTVNAINSYGCNKDNQDSAQQMVNTMHGQVNSVCPTVNVGSVATKYVDSGLFNDKWTSISYSIAQSFGIDERTKQCNSYDSNMLEANKYLPFHIFNLPPTRPYTVPETE